MKRGGGGGGGGLGSSASNGQVVGITAQWTMGREVPIKGDLLSPEDLSFCWPSLSWGCRFCQEGHLATTPIDNGGAFLRQGA